MVAGVQCWTRVYIRVCITLTTKFPTYFPLSFHDLPRIYIHRPDTHIVLVRQVMQQLGQVEMMQQ